MIRRMKNSDSGFYEHMGKIFGSRKVQKDTADRFYDDDGKEWISEIEKGAVLAVVSVKDYGIRNVYAEDAQPLITILKEIHAEVFGGTVPMAYKDAYIEAGYEISEEKKNFLVIKGGKSGG